MRKRRPNLCLFTNRFGHGGTEHQFADLVSRLDQSKYDLLVGCFSKEGEFYEKVAVAGLPVVEFTRGRWFAPDTLSCALAWMRLLRRQGIDLVHTFDYYTTVFAGTLARLAGIPLLVTSRRDTGSMYTPRQRWVDHLTLAEARGYLAEGKHFAAGSMGPKIQAVIAYLDGGGREALITDPDNLERALAGQTGTRITPD